MLLIEVPHAKHIQCTTQNMSELNVLSMLRHNKMRWSQSTHLLWLGVALPVWNWSHYTLDLQIKAELDRLSEQYACFCFVSMIDMQTNLNLSRSSIHSIPPNLYANLSYSTHRHICNYAISIFQQWRQNWSATR